jgi:hypothetical protein
VCGETLARVAKKSPWMGRYLVPKKPLPVDQDESLIAGPADSRWAIGELEIEHAPGKNWIEATRRKLDGYHSSELGRPVV